MSINFTDKQNKVLAARGHNVLVSAAAGSGKTAVLVERIVRMITEPVQDADGHTHLLDIDRLLVVTFTRAAAAQMRERIGTAISKRLEEDPGNRHLQRQETLLHHAQITTIDSFCTFLLRNHFSEIGLDPAFRQMDETESGLLLKDTLGSFLEEQYSRAAAGKNETVDKRKDTRSGRTESEDVAESAETADEMAGTRRETEEASACSFLECVDYFCTGSSDRELEDLILKLYHAADAHVDPAAWLAACRKNYDVSDAETYLSSPLLQQALERGREALQQMDRLYDEMISLCGSIGGPAPYLDFLAAEQAGILTASKALEKNGTQAECWNRIVTAVHYSYDRLPAIRGRKADGVDPEKKAQVQALRDESRNIAAGLRDGIFAQDAETAVQTMQKAAAPLAELTLLTEEFIEAYAAAKRRRNAIDFSDLERLSLQVLLPENEAGEQRPGKAAEGLRAYYDEILIDEYQDSNEVQELLLSTIAGEGWSAQPKPRFMVGDVKQSIYRFRNARPSIFVHKFETYQPDDPVFERIDLDQNFRSRREVLESVNAVFQKIMRREIGGVEYDDTVSLKPGADYPVPERWDTDQTELLAVTLDPTEQENPGAAGSNESGPAAGAAPESGDSLRRQTAAGQDSSQAREEAPDEIEQLSTHEKEALAIAQKIAQLRREQFPVMDENGSTRPVEYRDIVILVRSAASYNEAFRTIFEREGIPLYVDTRTGYFAAEEVREVLQFLRVLDNPLQDIPLYGVLRGYFGGFSQEELAQIRSWDRTSVLLYDAFCAYAGDSEEGSAEKGAAPDEPGEETVGRDAVPGEPSRNTNREDPEPQADSANTDGKNTAQQEFSRNTDGRDPALQERCRQFLDELHAWREKTATTTVSALLTQIVYDTGYMNHILALPSGEQREANVRELLVKARDFERTEYTGLFRFLRYIDQMHQFSVDYGEASVLDENADVVRLMTIHRSKGLEFPVCFVAGLGSRLAFRGKDTSGMLVTDPDLGCGIDCVDLTLRTRIPTLHRLLVADRIREESLGEELRVLYVAMTRAKEKLFLAGAVRSLEKRQQAMSDLLAVSGEGERGHLPAAAIRRAGSFLDLLLMSLADMPRTEEGRPVIRVAAVPVSDLQLAEALGQVSLGEKLSRLTEVSEDDSVRSRSEVGAELERRFSYVYPHLDLEGLFTKTTVTELKRASLEEAETGTADDSADVTGEGAVDLYPPEKENHVVPAFILQGAPKPVVPSASEDSTGQKGMRPAGSRTEKTSIQHSTDVQEKAAGVHTRLTGAARGTAIHRGCELIDYRRWRDPSAVTREDFDSWVNSLVSEGEIPPEYAEVMSAGLYLPFLHSPLAGRMAAADQKKLLRREQPFVYGVPSNRIRPAFPAGETVLIQGIIDAFFIEDGGIVVVDYKTDRVHSGAELREQYQIQLDYYAEALQSMLQLPVTEKCIYSFALQEEIRV